MDNHTDGLKYESKVSIYEFRHQSARQRGAQLPAVSYAQRSSAPNTWATLLARVTTPGECAERFRPREFSVLHETATVSLSSHVRNLLDAYASGAWRDLVLLAVVLIYVIDTTLFSFFERQKNSSVVCASLAFYLIYACDVAFVIALKFNVKWRTKLNVLEPNAVKIAVDVITALPLSLFFLLTPLDSGGHKFLGIIPFVSLIRLYRIAQYFMEKTDQAGGNQWSLFLIQYLTLLFIAVHTWTCIWYRFAFKGLAAFKSHESWVTQSLTLPAESRYDFYLLCTYWSVMIMTTDALGDLYPMTTQERISAIIATLLGFTLTTIVFVGSLTSQFITITRRKANYVANIKYIGEHLKQIKLDSETTSRIINYYSELWYQKSGVYQPKFLRRLPLPLQMEIAYDLNVVPLYSSLLFRRMPDAFLRHLSLVMRHQFYLPGDVVFAHNQNKNMMICITNGVLEFLSDEDDESPMISFKRGTCFGEITLVYSIPARCSVRAATYVECQTLNSSDFIRLMLAYPDIYREIKDLIATRLAMVRGAEDFFQTNEFTLNVYTSLRENVSAIKQLKDRLRYYQGTSEKIDIKNDLKQRPFNEEFLDLYLLSEHEKKKKINFICLYQNFPWILEPDSSMAQFWEMFMLLLIFVICIVYPYYITYERSFPNEFYFVQVIITLSLVANLAITAITAVKTKTRTLTTVGDILQYRMNTLGFYMDIIAVIPLEYLVEMHDKDEYYDGYVKHMFYLAKANKLCLVWRLSNFFEKLESKLLVNAIIVKTVKYSIFISLLCYWSGASLYLESCFISRCSANSWYAVTESMRPNISPQIISTYFATTLITSVGYGDNKPTDHYDMVLVAFLSLYGVLFIGFCISDFSSVVTHWSRIKTSYLEILLTIDRFLKDNNMNANLKKRIMAVYEMQWQYNKAVELTRKNWLNQPIAPSKLRKKVLHHSRYKAMSSLVFFQVKNKEFIQSLLECSKAMLLPPGEIVRYGGTITRELYILESGYCQVHQFLEDGTDTTHVVGPGSSFGIFVMLYGIPAISTISTLTHVKLIALDYAAFVNALSVFPEIMEHEGLMHEEEIAYMDTVARKYKIDTFLNQHHKNFGTDTKRNVQGTFKYFWNESVINVYLDYKERGESYTYSFNEFGWMRSVGPYILMPIVFKPDGPLLKCWVYLRICAAFLISLLVPITVALAPSISNINLVVSCLDAISYLDLFLMLHVSYYGPQNQLIYHPYMTAKNYLTKAFLLDLISCFPWSTLWLLFNPEHNEGHMKIDHIQNAHFNHCLGKLLSLLQFIKVLNAFWHESNYALRNAYVMNVVQFLLMTFFFLNMYACVMMILTCRYVIADTEELYHKKIKTLPFEGPLMPHQFHPEGNMICPRESWLSSTTFFDNKLVYTPMRVYLVAFYWAASSLSGAGFGDVVAKRAPLILLTMCINMHGSFFFGYVYASIAALKAVADEILTKFREDLKHLEMFLVQEKVPAHIKNCVIDYWKYQWKRTGGWSHQTILCKLHTCLNEDTVLFLYEKTLREMPLFDTLELSFFRVIARRLQEIYFTKGHIALRANQVIKHMYIIYRGKVDIISEYNEIEATMGPGGIFGNIIGVNRFFTQSTVVASRNIDLLYIEGTEFYSILKSYPAVMKKVKLAVQNAAKDYLLPTIINDDSNDIQYDADSEGDRDSSSDYSEEFQAAEVDTRSTMSTPSGIGSAHHIKAWKLLFCPHRWFRASLIPDDGLAIFMDYLILFLAYFDFMITVYMMSFQSFDLFFYLCPILDALFFYNSFMDMHTGFINRYGDYVLDPKKVRAMYFSKKSDRRRDFLSNLLICYLAYALPVNAAMQQTFFIYMRTLQLIRIFILFNYQAQKRITATTANLWFKIFFISLWTSVLLHVIACLFFKLSCLNYEHCSRKNWLSKPDLNLWKKYKDGELFTIYVAALWYVCNLFTITGIGDVSAINDFEVVETIIIIIIVKFCAGLLIAEISAMITSHSCSLMAYDASVKDLRDACAHQGLSEHQTAKMWDYVRRLWNRQQGKQIPQLIWKLPLGLRCETMRALYGSHLSGSVIFHGSGPDFLRMLASHLRHTVFFPSNYIVQDGDTDQSIYFIHRGEVEVLTVHANLTESIYDILVADDSFGIAQGLFVGVPHHFSFRARTTVDVVYLLLSEWQYLFDFFPNSARRIMNRVHNIYMAL